MKLILIIVLRLIWCFSWDGYTDDMITHDTPYIITPEMIRTSLASRGIVEKKRSMKEFIRGAKQYALQESLPGNPYKDIDSTNYKDYLYAR